MLFSTPDVLPYRLLEYTTKIYEKIVDKEKKYQKNLVKIPKPEFIVLYNGADDYHDYTELKLSDAFMDIEGLKLASTDKILLELIVPVYNINHGHNPEMLKKCENLYGYSLFINKIRKDYLETHASEVLNMLLGRMESRRGDRGHTGRRS